MADFTMEKGADGVAVITWDLPGKSMNVLTMQGAQADTPFRMTVRHAREAGATKDEIAETIAQMSMFAGIPAMTRAMELAREVMDVEKDDET